jgi:hypothetical protein
MSLLVLSLKDMSVDIKVKLYNGDIAENSNMNKDSSFDDEAYVP